MTHLNVRDYKAADFLDLELTEKGEEGRHGQPIGQWAQDNYGIY